MIESFEENDSEVPNLKLDMTELLSVAEESPHLSSANADKAIVPITGTQLNVIQVLCTY